jgi:hypothetical protein
LPATIGPPPSAVEVDVRHDEVGFRGVADLDSALLLALEAAVHIEDRRPSSELLDLLSGLPDEPMVWTERARGALLVLLERGGPRSWRFLFVTSLGRRALPELDTAIGDHIGDPFDLDPLGSMRWTRLARLVELGLETSKRPEQLALAALAVDTADGNLAEVCSPSPRGDQVRVHVAPVERERSSSRSRRGTAWGSWPTRPASSATWAPTSSRRPSRHGPTGPPSPCSRPVRSTHRARTGSVTSWSLTSPSRCRRHPPLT